MSVLFALTMSACGEAASPSGSTSSSPDGAALSIDLRYTCGTFPFDPEILTARPGNAETAADPVAATLRAHLAGAGPDIDFLPDAGWYLAGADARTAEFVVAGGDLGLKMVSLENSGAGWKVSGWGDCRPRVLLPVGLGAADWAFDPAQPKPGPATQTFTALVTEQACNSGEPADGRIVGPQLITTADAILVIFAVRPRPGGFQTCPSNPPTRVGVDLGQPLGDRKLLDGGRLPPGDPGQPAF
jgi:hypothetical protein